MYLSMSPSSMWSRSGGPGLDTFFDAALTVSDAFCFFCPGGATGFACFVAGFWFCSVFLRLSAVGSAGGGDCCGAVLGVVFVGVGAALGGAAGFVDDGGADFVGAASCFCLAACAWGEKTLRDWNHRLTAPRTQQAQRGDSTRPAASGERINEKTLPLSVGRHSTRSSRPTEWPRSNDLNP